MSKIVIADKEIKVRQIKVKDLPAVCTAAEPFIDKFGEMAKKGGISNSDLFKLCAGYSPDVVNLCVVLTDADKDWLRELEPKQLFDLTCEVIKGSQDFFLNQVIEPINEIAKQLSAVSLMTLVHTTK